MAKAKRERRTSIRTMPADEALEALELLERAERSQAERGDERRDGEPARTRVAQEGDED